ncbi:MAG TPA: response regulator [Kofleriaceae bacterium]|nr:response regulator [Kofleriaceae bacterium]
MSEAEKRRHTREPIRLLVEYEGADDLVGDYTENLSSGGTFVSTTRELETGTRVVLVLEFPGLLERITIPGTVRWTRGKSASDEAGAGIEFEPGPGRDQLAEAIERIRMRHPKSVARALHVLVVEDNVRLSETLQDGLRGSMRRDPTGPAFSFHSAEDGATALEILQTTPCDVMIIDVYLPVLDGTKVISHARSQLGLTGLPIIAFSGGGDEAREAALDAGANAFLDKPMRLRQVLDTIQRLVP